MRPSVFLLHFGMNSVSIWLSFLLEALRTAVAQAIEWNFEIGLIGLDFFLISNHITKVITRQKYNLFLTGVFVSPLSVA